MTNQPTARPNLIDLTTLRNPVVIPALMALVCGIAPAWGATPVMVQEYEKVSSPPTVQLGTNASPGA